MFLSNKLCSHSRTMAKMVNLFNLSYSPFVDHLGCMYSFSLYLEKSGAIVSTNTSSAPFSPLLGLLLNIYWYSHDASRSVNFFFLYVPQTGILQWTYFLVHIFLILSSPSSMCCLASLEKFLFKYKFLFILFQFQNSYLVLYYNFYIIIIFLFGDTFTHIFL